MVATHFVVAIGADEQDRDLARRRPAILSRSSVASSDHWRSSSTTTSCIGADRRRNARKLSNTPSRSPTASASRSDGPTRSAKSASGANGRGGTTASQVPHRTWRPGPCAAQKASTNAVLPTPASPEIRARRPRPARVPISSSLSRVRLSSRSSSGGRGVR